MFCSRCGAATADSDAFCATCGQPTSPAVTPTTTGLQYGAPLPPPPLPPYGATAATTNAAGRFVDPDTGRVLSGWWKRVGAYVLDAVIVGIPVEIIWRIVAGSSITRAGYSCGPQFCTNTNVFHPGVFFGGLGFDWVVFGTYLVLMIGSARGQTVGMMALGISVRDATTDASIGYRRAFVRYLVIWALGLPLGIPVLIDYLAPLWDRRKQAWHDHAANSVVTDLR
jgi:uncharacterized RDD family membrane protein YckC